MIDAVVREITNQLNRSLQQAFQITENIAVASPLVGLDGSVITGAANKVCTYVVNLEQDPTSFVSICH